MERYTMLIELKIQYYKNVNAIKVNNVKIDRNHSQNS